MKKTFQTLSTCIWFAVLGGKISLNDSIGPLPSKVTDARKKEKREKEKQTRKITS